MRLVAQRAALRRWCMRRTYVKRLIPPVCVARCAAQPRFLGNLLYVRIVARATFRTVRIARRIEVRDHRVHFMTCVALRKTRADGPRRRGGVFASADFRGESVAGDAVQRSLIRHSGELDRDTAMATGGTARCVDGSKPMHLHAVAGDALHFGKRGIVRFEVDLVACGLADVAPGLRFAGDVALFAAIIRNRRVIGDVLGTLRHPKDHLPPGREDRLLMAIVAAQLMMRARRETLKRRLHDVAGGAKIVVVLHVMPRSLAPPCGRAGDDCDRDREAPAK